MSTRKRSRKVDESDFANTQHIQTKVPRKNKTTTLTDTDTDAVDADEHKIDTNSETMSTEGNGLATGSTERANDESTEFDQNSNPGYDSSEDTEMLLRESDVLMAQIAEFQRETLETPNQNDSQATIIIPEAPDAAHPTNTSADNTNIPTTSGQNRASSSANDSHNAIDDSVVLIEDTNSNTVRPIVKDDDEDVIFVTESRASQRFRTIATIDLCDTPDTSFTRSRGSEQSTSAAPTGAAAAAAASQSANDLSPRRPGTTKCPICLEIFGFNEILSTMCGHLFCEPCIKNVIKARKKCPMCNRGLKQNQVHRIFLDT